MTQDINAQLEVVKALQKKLEEANKKAKSNDLKNDAHIRDLSQATLDVLKQVTGDTFFIGKQKDIFAGEPFNQVIHRNLDLLTQIKYLDQKEESFLFRIQAYLEFKTNVIICREDKFKRKRTKKEELESNEEPAIVLPKAATVSDIAKMIGLSRQNTSTIMNSLKEKEILLNPEGAGLIVENGRTVSPRTWIVNPYILINAPRKSEVKLDMLTMRLFQHSLKNLTDEKGKKVKLPVRFF